MNEYQMAENAHVRSLWRIVGWSIVAVVASISTCCVLFPWNPSDAEQCAKVCAPNRVVRFSPAWRCPGQEAAHPMACECAP